MEGKANRQTETERGRQIIIDGEQADRREKNENENNMSGEIHRFVSGTLSSHTPVTQAVMPTGARRRLNNFLSCPRQSHASSCIPISRVLGCFLLLLLMLFASSSFFLFCLLMMILGLMSSDVGLIFFFSFSSFLLNLFCGTHRSRVAIDLRLEQSLPGKGDIKDKLLPMQQVPPLHVTEVPPSLRH